MQYQTQPLKRRGTHPGHGTTTHKSRPALHPFQYLPAPQQPHPQQPHMSPFGPEYLPVNPPTPMFHGSPLAAGQGGAFNGAPGYAPAPRQVPHPGLAYQPAPPHTGHQRGHSFGGAGGGWPSNPAYGAPPPWWAFKPEQDVEPEESQSEAELLPQPHPLFQPDNKGELLHELQGHTMKLPNDWQVFNLSVPHPALTPHNARKPHTRALLGESAMEPPVSKLRLVSPHLPWPIDVLPAPPKSPKSPKFSFKKAEELFVTVGDVLAALHRSLSICMTEGEYFIGSDADRARINTAFKHIVKQKERQQEEGVKRVDYLGAMNFCLGFRLPESDKEEKWVKERLLNGKDWSFEDVYILELEGPDDEEM